MAIRPRRGEGWQYLGGRELGQLLLFFFGGGGGGLSCLGGGGGEAPPVPPPPDETLHTFLPGLLSFEGIPYLTRVVIEMKLIEQM